jgi:threonine aldolase
MPRYIDLRSDTVTVPTAEMRDAMARAEVGDDVYGEDPTVNELQALAAKRLGKEAALFVPSGTMGNQICVKLHTRLGQEIIVDERSHMFNLEMAAMAVISGCLAHPVKSEDGLMDWPGVEAAIRPLNDHYAQTGLISVENTNNLAGGTVVGLSAMARICDQAQVLGIPVHLDGARIFNAAIALGCDVSDIARPFDSVMFCLSKGLGAPVGSMIAGSRRFIESAIPVRRMFGGAMRQAGVLAAAGLVALRHMTERLVEDHANALLLAQGVAAIPGLGIDPEKVRTNILAFDVSAIGLSADGVISQLKVGGVLANSIGPYRVRLVTHKDVSRSDCETATDIIREVIGRARK